MSPTGADDALLSLDEYVRLREPDEVRSELVRGRLVREPRPGARHGWIQVRVARLLVEHAEAESLGEVFSDVGVILGREPPTVRGPDVSFVSSGRLPDELGEGFLEVAPDLAVEVVSPSNRAREIREKVVDYLDAGTRLVWVVDPGPRIVTVCRSRRDVEVLREEDVLDGGVVLPGFRARVSDLFPG